MVASIPSRIAGSSLVGVLTRVLKGEVVILLRLFCPLEGFVDLDKELDSPLSCVGIFGHAGCDFHKRQYVPKRLMHEPERVIAGNFHG